MCRCAGKYLVGRSYQRGILQKNTWPALPSSSHLLGKQHWSWRTERGFVQNLLVFGGLGKYQDVQKTAVKRWLLNSTSQRLGGPEWPPCRGCCSAMTRGELRVGWRFHEPGPIWLQSTMAAKCQGHVQAMPDEQTSSHWPGSVLTLSYVLSLSQKRMSSLRSLAQWIFIPTGSNMSTFKDVFRFEGECWSRGRL